MHLTEAVESTLKLNFRPDINGLRAWAVVAVVLYHFGVPGFGGGFVGVDVFFTISGFLMTGIVIKGLESGQFSLLAFYMARARRIVPALIAVCLTLMVLGWFFLPPPDYKMLSTHVIASLGFFSNIKYWTEAGYFDSASHDKWLLHTWSLAVEWQFYLLLPLMLWAIWHLKPSRKALAGALLASFVLSLCASIIVTQDSPSTAFFLLHTRAWEMLAGGLVHFLPSARANARGGSWLVTAGLSAIALSSMGFDKHLAWPGSLALVPVLATALILWVNKVSIGTSLTVAQLLGDRSYSIYLWHWPIVVALTYLELQQRTAAIVSGIAITLIVGHASYHLIENPVREYLNAVKLKLALSILISVTSLICLSGLIVRQLAGVPHRFSPEIELAASESLNINPQREKCKPKTDLISPTCRTGGDRNLKAILIGDSHAAAVITGLSTALRDKDDFIFQLIYEACPTVRAAKEVGRDSRPGSVQPCADFMEWAIQQLEKTPAHIPLIIVNRTTLYFHGDNAEIRKSSRPLYYFTNLHESADDSFVSEYSDRLVETYCHLARFRPVYLVRPIPELVYDVPKTSSRRMVRGINGDISISMTEYRQRHRGVWLAQDRAHDACGVKILDPLPYLCSGDICEGKRNGRPIYYDDNHLSEFGNKLLTSMFTEVFQTQ